MKYPPHDLGPEGAPDVRFSVVRVAGVFLVVSVLVIVEEGVQELDADEPATHPSALGIITGLM